MESFGVHVEGLDEVLAKLKFFSGDALKKALARGLAAAGVPIFGAIQTRAELHDRTDSETSTGGGDFGGHLADDLASTIIIDASGKAGRLSIGFNKQAAKALWLEYGHRMVSHRPDKRILVGPRTSGGFVIPGGTEHPGPFMRPALDEVADQAVQAFFDTFMASLQEDWNRPGSYFGTSAA